METILPKLVLQIQLWQVYSQKTAQYFLMENLSIYMLPSMFLILN